jgi:hypothetical protein
MSCSNAVEGIRSRFNQGLRGYGGFPLGPLLAILTAVSPILLAEQSVPRVLPFGYVLIAREVANSHEIHANINAPRTLVLSLAIAIIYVKQHFDVLSWYVELVSFVGYVLLTLLVFWLHRLYH